MKKDEEAVQNILSIITTTFIDPLSPFPLISISTGVQATEKVTTDILSVKKVGKAAMKKFISSRLSDEKSLCFFNPITKLKLGTFKNMVKVKKYKVNSKVIPVQATKDLFAKIALVVQIRSLDLKSVFKYPLGP